MNLNYNFRKKILHSPRHSVKRKKEQIQMLAIENENLTKSFYIASSISGKRKKLKRTPGSLNYRTKVTCCRETIVECNTIHDGSVENKKSFTWWSAWYHQCQIIFSKNSCEMLSSKISLKKAFSRKCIDRSKI